MWHQEPPDEALSPSSRQQSTLEDHAPKQPQSPNPSAMFNPSHSQSPPPTFNQSPPNTSNNQLPSSTSNPHWLPNTPNLSSLQLLTLPQFPTNGLKKSSKDQNTPNYTTTTLSIIETWLPKKIPLSRNLAAPHVAGCFGDCLDCWLCCSVFCAG